MKAEPMFKPPPLPEPDFLPDLLQAWSHCKEEELLFMQLPDSLPGQPPSSDARPTKTTVQSEDGQNMLQKTEGQVRGRFLSIYGYYRSYIYFLFLLWDLNYITVCVWW